MAALATGLLPAQALAADYFVVLPTGAAKAMAPTPGNEINVSLGAYTLPTLTEGLTYELDFNNLLTVTGDSDYNSTQVNWSVDPAFPPWASFIAGVLTGTPSGATDSTHTVTAQYKGNSSSQTYNLTAPTPYYKLANGVTVRCIGMADGSEFTLDGKTYRVVYSKADAKTYAASACTSNMTDMSYMNFGTNFNEDISHWDTSSVTSMGYMFGEALAFNQDIGAWDTSSVTDMSSMFYQAGAFNQDIGAWDTSSATDMSDMFFQAYAFNQDIGAWDTSSVNYMIYMFFGASAFNQDLSGWCVTSITSKPILFDSTTTAWVKAGRQPVWGTCPTP